MMTKEELYIGEIRACLNTIEKTSSREYKRQLWTTIARQAAIMRDELEWPEVKEWHSKRHGEQRYGTKGVKNGDDEAGNVG